MTFIRAFESLDRLKEPKAFLAWLLRIASNVTTDAIRARRSMVSLDQVSDVDGDQSESADHRNLENQEEFQSVLRALGDLPDRYREVITLKYLDDMDGQTMAAHLNEPEGTVRNRLFRALQKLREKLQDRSSSIGGRGRRRHRHDERPTYPV